MTNTDKCHKILASFLFSQEGALHYKSSPHITTDLIVLHHFDVIDNGTVRFHYFSYNENNVLRDVIDTRLFEKLFSIDVSKLLEK